MNRNCLAILVITLVCSAVVSAADWEWDNPYPVGNFIFTSWAFSPTDVYFAGEYGTVLHYQGSDLTTLSSSPTAVWSDIYDLWGTGSTLYGLATGLDGAEVIVKYQGGVWTRVVETTPFSLYSIWGTGPNNIFAVGDAGYIVHYDGTSWELMDVPDETVTLYWVYGFSPTEVYAVGDLGTAWLYDGTSWQDAGWNFYENETISCFWGSGAGDLFVGVTLSGEEYDVSTIYHLEDNYWVPYFEAEEYYFFGIYGVTPTKAWLTGTDSFLEWNGVEWVEATDPALMNLWEVQGCGANAVFAAGRSKVLKNNGASWSSLSSGFYENMYAVWGSSPTNIYAVGDSGPYREPIQQYNGYYWEGINVGTFVSFLDVHGSGASNVWAVGELGTVVRYNGSSWSLMETPSEMDFWGVWSFSPTNTFAIGLNEAGGTTLYWYNGSTWTEHFSTQDKEGFFDIWASAPDDIYLCGTSGSIWHYNGNVWGKSTIGSDDVLLITGSRAGCVYAVTYSEDLVAWFYQLINGTWVKLAEEIPVLIPMGIWASSPNNIYLADAYHQVLRFDGLHWDVEPVDVASFIYAIWGSSAGDLWIVGDFGAVLNSTGDLNFDLETSSDLYAAGDTFILTCDINNPAAQSLNVNLFVALDVYGTYFFYPSWREYNPNDPASLDWAARTITTGLYSEEILRFPWPTGAGAAAGINFIGAMLDRTTGEVVANIPITTFGFE